jgi:hypothetical protein
VVTFLPFFRLEHQEVPGTGSLLKRRNWHDWERIHSRLVLVLSFYAKLIHHVLMVLLCENVTGSGNFPSYLSACIDLKS